MVNVPRTSPIFLVLVLAAALQAQTGGILPLREVRPGMKAVGRSVFAGMKVEEFQVEVLGVLENAGPKQSIILARLSGAGLENRRHAGHERQPRLLQRPVDGRRRPLVPFLQGPHRRHPPHRGDAHRQPLHPPDRRGPLPLRRSRLAAQIAGPRSRPAAHDGDRHPFWLSGFTRNTVDYFAPALRAAGLEPVQGVSGGGRAIQAAGASKTPLEPGSMISVQLVRGDLNVGADGTVTHIDGNRVYAFGHRFLAIGDTEMPFARSEVITLLASNNQSFKISTRANGSAPSHRTAASPSPASSARRPT